MIADVESKIQYYPQKVTLLDGSQVVLRLICPEDKPGLLSFHSRVSDESRFLRYHYLKGALTESDLHNFCDTDPHNNVALVVERELEGKKDIIGVGRYIRLPDGKTAEIAFVVQDNEQKKGIGTILLKHLAALAWQQGIRHFCGEVLRQNARMLSIFRKFDPSMDLAIDDTTTCSVVLSVADAMDAKLVPQVNENPQTLTK